MKQVNTEHTEQQQQKARFDDFVKQHELTKKVSDQLYYVLTNCEIVLICDDSASMQQVMREDGGQQNNKNTANQTTRWTELRKLAAEVIKFVTATNPNGLDIYFLNRATIQNVTGINGLQTVFSEKPTGATPLLGKLRQVYNDKLNIINTTNKQLLIIVLTDGQASDGNLDDLRRLLQQMTSNNKVHISIADCTDNEQEMEFYDELDNQVRNFDNTDSYRAELEKIKRIQGQQFKFDYTDYVIKILLASHVRWYFNLDQYNANTCCTII